MRKNNCKKMNVLGLILALLLFVSACSGATSENTSNSDANKDSTAATTQSENIDKGDSEDNASQQDASVGAMQNNISLSDIPAYSGAAYVEINNNQPYFTEEELQRASSSYESYSHLDSLGRCGVCIASVGQDIMPTEKRGAIGQVRPSGWHTVKYDNIADRYLYNRCHLIGYQLTGENANENNLITGTRYLNVEGMLPFEDEVADYVKQTNHHVLYRVTPIFDGNNLVANGVLMEGKSVEDNGSGVCFNVYCYNVQPGIGIDYATGNSWQDDNASSAVSEQSSSGSNAGGTTDSYVGSTSENVTTEYVLNTNTKKFHRPNCYSTKTIKDANKETYMGSRADLISQGYEPCKNCNP